ncbi:MAG: VOC family protein [Candidatus Wallbacteria bacterium]|nr:VOC family protein [Candidatus Wallbacteria bacterium]
MSRSAKFYRAAFGWKVRLEVPVLVEFELPDGKGLGLYQRESFALNTKQAPVEVKTGKITGTELYFGVDDLDAAIERLKTAGARVLSEKAARDWGDVAAYFSDPDGNVLVVSHPAK